MALSDSADVINQHPKKPLRIGLVVGEASGALIALGMIKKIKALHPDCIIEGIGSVELEEQGMYRLFDMEELSVMGLVEVLKHLPRLLHIKKSIIKHFTHKKPDIFIGVDAPDFNLPVEKQLKALGIKTVHYVSPTVWAWREKRIHKIKTATNLVLGVFPFEQEVYDKHNVPFKFVGHTTADHVPKEYEQSTYKRKLNINIDKPCFAMLPGSRSKEVELLLPVFIEAYKLFSQTCGDFKVIIPAVNEQRELQIKSYLTSIQIPFDVMVSRESARDIMMASDIVLLASGTAALEAMLCKRPMVVAYKMSKMTYWMMKRLYKPKYFALPNILAGRLLAPELLQEDVNPQTICEHLVNAFTKDASAIKTEFDKQHSRLALGADERSAEAVLSLVQK